MKKQPIVMVSEKNFRAPLRHRLAATRRHPARLPHLRTRTQFAKHPHRRRDHRSLQGVGFRGLGRAL